MLVDRKLLFVKDVCLTKAVTDVGGFVDVRTCSNLRFLCTCKYAVYLLSIYIYIFCTVLRMSGGRKNRVLRRSGGHKSCATEEEVEGSPRYSPASEP